ncbi:MAG: DUF411 domain-containing protein [Pseudomonadota bacterium]|jgi:hypothetical protein
MHRRQFLIAAATLSLGPAAFAQRVSLPEVVVYKDPNCGCCGAWADHLRDSGFPVKVIENRDMTVLKQRLGVPDKLASCHTAEVGGYILEGHVPAQSVKRLLAEKPKVKGLAVPGMPAGSPGMEVGNRRDPYDVVAFGAEGSARVFDRYR